MAFKHYLLGYLADEPMSGYSLYKHTFAPFRRPLSQIYRTLNKMTEEGFLEVERVVQEKLPNQNVYRITKTGRAELVRWLKQKEPVTVSHFEVLGKLWLGSRVEKKHVMNHLEFFAEHVQEQLEYFKLKARPLVEQRAKERGHSLETAYQLLSVDYSIQQYEVALTWAMNALKEIESLQPEGVVTGGAETKKRVSAQEVALL